MKKPCVLLALLALALLALAGGPAIAQKKPAAKAPVKKVAAETAASVLRGKPIYTQYCLSCHHADGGGVAGLKPPLPKTSYLLGQRSKLILVLLMGKWDEGIDGELNQKMPAQEFLTNQQIADVLTYVRNSFGNKASAIKAPEVASLRRIVDLKSGKIEYHHSAADTLGGWGAPR